MTNQAKYHQLLRSILAWRPKWPGELNFVDSRQYLEEIESTIFVEKDLSSFLSNQLIFFGVPTRKKSIVNNHEGNQLVLKSQKHNSHFVLRLNVGWNNRLLEDLEMLTNLDSFHQHV